MDTPPVRRIDSYTRVSAAARSNEAKNAHASRGFSALLVDEDADGRRRRAIIDEDPPSDGELAAPAADLADETGAEPLTEEAPAPDGDDVLPEDAHDGQELRALLNVPHD
jgi:hypothetical protein